MLKREYYLYIDASRLKSGKKSIRNIIGRTQRTSNLFGIVTVCTSDTYPTGLLVVHGIPSGEMKRKRRVFIKKQK